MKRAVILSAVLLAAAELAAGPRVCGVTLVQWNLHIGIDMNYRWNLKTQADVLNRLDGDVTILNEVDKNCARTGYCDMTKELAVLTGTMFSQFSAARALPPEGLYGNAILSRYPMELVGAWLLPSPADESRSMTLMKIKAPVPFLLGFTHLNFRQTPEENLIRIAAVRKIHELIERNNPGRLPAVLAGDFNCRPGDDPVKELEKLGWTMGKPLATFPSKKPVSSIDHIFCRDVRAKVLDRIPVDEKTASDHIPVVNKLEIFRSIPK
ncbi:MAG: endonuclease/exonuclease/phosphatase family protein [Lentisphaeria bacterium]|nr:endonuclease/exonuclease/phosphatase family protein [Lentisphaeria bacterium]